MQNHTFTPRAAPRHRFRARRLRFRVRPSVLGNALGDAYKTSQNGTISTEDQSSAETRRLLGHELSSYSDAQQQHIRGLADRANADLYDPNSFQTLREASDTQFAAGQDLSTNEIQRRTNNYLGLAGATPDQINQVNSIYGQTGVLRNGSVSRQFQLNPDGSLRTPSADSSALGGDTLPEQDTRPQAFVFNRSIDTTIIGTGKVLTQFGEFVESNPIAKYSLLALDVASGPAIYGVRNFTPVGDLLSAAQSKVAGFFSDGLQDAGRAPIDSQAGGIGGTAILSVGAGGFSGAVKGLKGLISDFKAVESLEVGSFSSLKARAVVGDVLEHDHIPSAAALRQAKEAELGRELNVSEKNALYNNATAIELPKDVHIEGRTYGGKNTSQQIQQDAANLGTAVTNDTAALRTNLLNRGYNSVEVEQAINKIIERNKQLGITK